MPGFNESTLRIIQLPQLSDHLPYLFDDCSLAFYLSIRPKTLWWILRNTNQQYRTRTIPKKRGTRLIHEPGKSFKAILRRANNRLLVPLQEQLGAHVTAYRPGLSVRDAVLQHIPQCPVCASMPNNRIAPKHDCPREGTCIQLDLKNFFHAHRRAWIRKYFQSLGYSHLVAGYLASLFTVTNIPNPNASRNEKHNPTERKFFSGVPQGSPTSGSLCNLIADYRLDSRILPQLADWNREFQLKGAATWVYTRYADDLTLSCGRILSPDQRKAFTKQIVTTIRRAGYEANPTKTRYSQGNKRRFILGMTCNHHPNYRKDKYRALRSLVYNCFREGFDSQYERAKRQYTGQFDSIEQFKNWLHGTIQWICQVNPEKGTRLLAIYQEAQ